MDFIKINNAYELRDFLNGHSAKDLRARYIINQDGAHLRGIRIVVNTLTDGSETVDFKMEWKD